MTYPNQPNFASAEQDATWWKVTNPTMSAQYICMTNGPGFISQLKPVLAAFMRERNLTYVTRPDALRTNALTDEGLGTNNTKWTETLISLLATWFRIATSGTDFGTGITAPGATGPLPTPPSLTYANLVTGLPAWAVTVHDALKNEFVAQRVGPATLKVATWALVQARDRATGARLGDPQAPTGEHAGIRELTQFANIWIRDNPALPPWDVAIPGTPQQFVCSQVNAAGELVPTQPGGPTPISVRRALFDFRGLSTNDKAKLAILGVAGIAAGHYIANQKRGKKRRGKKAA